MAGEARRPRYALGPGGMIIVHEIDAEMDDADIAFAFNGREGYRYAL